MEEGRLVEWKKQEGEPVAVGDVLAEVETDKAVMELVARAAGTMLKHIVEAGSTVPVSEPVAVIGEPGEAGGTPPAAEGKGTRVNSGPRETEDSGTKEQPRGKEAQGTQPSPGQNRPVSMPPAPPAEKATEERPPQEKAPARAGNGAKASASAAAPAEANRSRVKASPLARRIAAERGLDLVGVTGSGPEGRVVARDLEGAVAKGAPSPATPPVSIPSQRSGQPKLPSRATPSTGDQPYTDTPLTQIRKTIARRLTESIGPVPTFYLTSEVDMERVWEAREAQLSAGQRGSGADEPVKVSFNDIVIKAVAMALRQHPACNAWWQNDHIRYWNEVHVSMAVAIEEGLITPVIRYADLKSLREISAESRDLARRARERRLKPEEYTGGTFSVSNLGMLDIEEFTAIINPPEAGILAIGRIVEKAVAHEGALALRRRMRLTMSCDHRVIDGATGAQFLKTLKGMLENPLALVW
jgi:pyruvate dehydrogenase E2 component (dihydrolipoamide acetyltransferase)